MPRIHVGQEKFFTIKPENSAGPVTDTNGRTWLSSNPGVLDVTAVEDFTRCKVVGVAPGVASVVVKATPPGEPEKVESIEVTVVALPIPTATALNLTMDPD